MNREKTSCSIALLGASSQIAKDLIRSLSMRSDLFLLLYVRDVPALCSWIDMMGVQKSRISVHNYRDYGREPHDAVINFVGVGDPRRAAQMGASIFELTQRFDDLVLEQLIRNPSCRYIFMSSGAVYGDSFSTPVGANSVGRIPINHIGQQEYYAIAKLYAEARHRSLPQLMITDVRIFNYFSRSQDLNSRFFISDILRSIIEGKLMQTSNESICRDFVHPIDFLKLIDCILTSEPRNNVVDVYSREPVEKFTLLEAMRAKFGLRYEIVEGAKQFAVNATGKKSQYYSLNHKARELGYAPQFSALECVLSESSVILGKPIDNLH